MYRLNLGEKIRTQRKALGVRINSAARASGISRSTLIRIERGNHSVGIVPYINLCKALGMDLNILEPLGLPILEIKKDVAQSNIAGQHIRIGDYPQLTALAWQLDVNTLLTDMEARGLYERNKRFLEALEIQEHEKLLMQRLINECDMEQLI